jgi:hypothetical protein
VSFQVSPLGLSESQRQIHSLDPEALPTLDKRSIRFQTETYDPPGTDLLSNFSMLIITIEWAFHNQVQTENVIRDDRREL